MDSFQAWSVQPGLPRPLDQTLSALLTRRGSLGRLRRLSPPISLGPGPADFSSNDYLLLSTSPDVQQAFLARLRHDFPRLGSGGSRLLDRNSSLAESVEQRIAIFHGAEAVLLFTSAFDANVGLLACAPQPGNIVLYDELIHASVHGGLRFSRAGKRLAFQDQSVVAGPPAAFNAKDTHPDYRVGSGPPSLDEALHALVARDGGVRAGSTNVFICVEGIYSMDGDHLHAHNGYVIVDEAHSVGVLGPLGRGLVAESNIALQKRVWARVLGFGKALGCAGGVALGSEVVRDYLFSYARTLIYTTAMGHLKFGGAGCGVRLCGKRPGGGEKEAAGGSGESCISAVSGDPSSAGGRQKLHTVGEDVPKSPIIPVSERSSRLWIEDQVKSDESPHRDCPPLKNTERNFGKVILFSIFSILNKTPSSTNDNNNDSNSNINSNRNTSNNNNNQMSGRGLSSRIATSAAEDRVFAAGDAVAEAKEARALARAEEAVWRAVYRHNVERVALVALERNLGGWGAN
ncbi:Putative 8-amino-7-oxononanoate synthase [Cytospora mali]|uniref:8-amino-7-oxononanoate synthase n=1 Tax=Cytospora mali TaxID=578113 RepID=A0A194WDL6_CYTMA|nr:Putative 8-amino-7-oxononanoate synthase [Valsa mali]